MDDQGQKPNVCFNDPTEKLPGYLYGDLGNEKSHKYLEKMLEALALCHTIVVDSVTGQYNASSPDELALVNFAKQCGYSFEGIDDYEILHVNTPKGKRRYKLLHVCPFNSDRKRMSVIVMDEAGIVKLICKGADQVILSLLCHD